MEEIKKLLSLRMENEYFDIKEKYYEKTKKYELVKDICAFLNNCIDIDKYIVFGVEDNTWKIVGMQGQPKIEISNIQQLLNQYVEPSVMIDVGEITVDGKTLGYIKIRKDNLDRPYIIKKSASDNNRFVIREGEIYIRKGATNFIANRKDLDNIYNKRQKFSIRIDSNINIVKIQDQLRTKKYISLNIDFVNELEKNYVIESVCLMLKTNKRIIYLDKAVGSISNISIKDKLIIDKTNPITICAQSEINRNINFCLSDDILELVNEENIDNLKIIFNKNSKDERLFTIEKFEFKKE